MHPAVSSLLHSLTFGKQNGEGGGEKRVDTVGRLAQVYEIARNALEYRADHLVRRAAIERILKRQLVFGGSTTELTDNLMTELKWATYLTEVEEELPKKKEIREVLDQYLPALNSGSVSHDWLVGLISAHIEDVVNPNVDYHMFTPFAFHALRTRVKIPNVENLDLVLFVAVDRVYSLSDEQQLSYHLLRLLKKQTGKQGAELLELAWEHFQAAVKSSALNPVTAFVRRQVGPLVLVRDMYFADPEHFVGAISTKENFWPAADMVLDSQLGLAGRRINTATWRSLIYVFLTKMILVILLEMPFERAISGHVNWTTTSVNMVFPVLFMWLMAATIKLPDEREQERLLTRAWQVVSDFEAIPASSEVMLSTSRSSRGWFILYYLLYGAFFVVTFTLIVWGLTSVGYTAASILVFLFFLSIVAFFAYRIRQTALIYSYNPKATLRSSLVDSLMLPIVVVGGALSSGVARFNL